VTKDHPLIGRGMLWVFLEMAKDFTFEAACELGIRRCKSRCPLWKLAWRDVFQSMKFVHTMRRGRQP
jgi:hypothetical protein